MDNLLPKELLLLSQAFVVHGSAQLDAVSKALMAHPITQSRPSSLFSPQSCLQVLQEMLAAESLDLSRLPELKRPNARIHLKLARKYYMARLAELRSKLSLQEDQIRRILHEEAEINAGAWDAKLTQGYDLITPSEEPAQAVYKHKYSAGRLDDPSALLPSRATEPALASAAATASTSTNATTIITTQQTDVQPKEEVASPAKELQFAEEITTIPDSDGLREDSNEEGVYQREGTAASSTAALQDVPEEDEDAAADTSSKTVKDDVETAVVEAGSSRPSRKSSVPLSLANKTGASSSTATTSKPTHERRSSSRVSRSSIANLSEILPPTPSTASSTVAAETSAPATSAPDTSALEVEDEDEDKAAAPSPAKDGAAPSSESMDIDMQSAQMERDDSKDSSAEAPTTTTTSATAGTKRGRPARKSSLPPVSTKDANKRKRTTTPQAQAQAQNRTTSPAPSERSRSKRVKTEEPESGLGTPIESDRTPGNSSSDASTIRRFKNAAPHLISQMVSSVNSTYFKEPVRQGEAVNYFEIIKRPMDLKTLSQNVRSGKVTTSAEFTRDLALIFANAIMYNGLEHHVGQDAVNMWREAQDLLRVLEAAEQRAM